MSGWNQFLQTAAPSSGGTRLNWLSGPLAVLIVVAFAAMIGITFLQVVWRYVFGAPLSWSEEASIYLFTWIVFLGAALGLGKGVHLGVDILVRLLPAGLQAILGLLTRILTLAFVLALFGASLPLLRDNASQISPALELPMTAVYAAIPLAMLAMAIISLAQIAAQIRGWRGRAPGK